MISRITSRTGLIVIRVTILITKTIVAIMMTNTITSVKLNATQV
jgi:hypothetical protein